MPPPASLPTSRPGARLSRARAIVPSQAAARKDMTQAGLTAILEKMPDTELKTQAQCHTTQVVVDAPPAVAMDTVHPPIFQLPSHTGPRD